MNNAKDFLDDLSAAFAALPGRRREAETMIRSGRKCICIACGEPLTAGTVEVLPVIDLRHCAIWMAAVHRECAERYGDVLADVIQRKMDGEAAH